MKYSYKNYLNLAVKQNFWQNKNKIWSLKTLPVIFFVFLSQFPTCPRDRSYDFSGILCKILFGSDQSAGWLSAELMASDLSFIECQVSMISRSISRESGDNSKITSNQKKNYIIIITMIETENQKHNNVK